jgi:hypothetical protein
VACRLVAEEVWVHKGVSEFEHTEQDEEFLRILGVIVEGDIEGVEKEGYLAADVINIACGHTYLGEGRFADGAGLIALDESSEKVAFVCSSEAGVEKG